MNQSKQSPAPITEALKAEALDCLRKHVTRIAAEEAAYLAEVLPKFDKVIQGRGLLPEDVYPWVKHLMFSAVMPDHSVCERTKELHFKEHITDMVRGADPSNTSLDLRRAMVENGFIYSYYDDAEDIEPAEFAAVTGYGIAKMLGIDIRDFVNEHWPARSTAS